MAAVGASPVADAAPAAVVVVVDLASAVSLAGKRRGSRNGCAVDLDIDPNIYPNREKSERGTLWP
jgi:hypothetical protein